MYLSAEWSENPGETKWNLVKNWDEALCGIIWI